MMKHTGIFVSHPKNGEEATKILAALEARSEEVINMTGDLRAGNMPAINIVRHLAAEGLVSFIEEVFVEGEEGLYYEKEAIYLKRLSEIDAELDRIDSLKTYR